MLKVNLFDHEFSHTKELLGYITCSDTLKPLKIEWLNKLEVYNGITIFTDRFLCDPIVKSSHLGIKIAWLLEPPAIREFIYKDIIAQEDNFDFILTYDETLLKKNSKYIKYTVGQSRIPTSDSKIYFKDKKLSMIASNKITTVGHNFRHEIASKLSNKYSIDMWGSGYKPFKDKAIALKDYHFSISIMNCKMNNFFTEVLVDNFMVGTVPIFWGCPNIEEYFDPRGIIVFNTINDLENILNNISEKDYYNRLKYINDNLIIAKKHISTDDTIADILIKLLK